ncbi:MAG: hypothetical protein COY81_03540 [Candidatus Pacebacteria bacterium CG_4_10_14_0_8_um_filter_43_12]|nr:MAG: hypothetical protein COU66_02820 [Candidatus Pacebacteria bacterium CG10_big_fil_rev_8_21_14_0_10_44_11]PIY79258.1 MAG: hypothetical protein COY81_03540 [Candidatus Pacebacteria bacterium CG_4_10_14_0_8_um_filter_43_12]
MTTERQFFSSEPYLLKPVVTPRLDYPSNSEQQLLEKMYPRLANQAAPADRPKVRKFLADVIRVVLDNPQAPDFELLELVIKTNGYHLLLLAFQTFDIAVWDTIEEVREALASPDKDELD